MRGNRQPRVRRRKAAAPPAPQPLIGEHVPDDVPDEDKNGAVVELPTPEPPAAPADTEELPPLQKVNAVLHQQVACVRNAFFRLAQVRAADLVRFDGKSWDEGAAYINAEMAGLDSQIMALVPLDEPKVVVEPASE